MTGERLLPSGAALVGQGTNMVGDASHEIVEADFAEFVGSGAVNEVFIVEVQDQEQRKSYRLEVLLTWRPGRSVLVVARGGERRWRKLDTLVRFLRSCGVRQTLLKMELCK